MATSFSIVYPTRHRPEFIRQALRILETQRHDAFEVIVSDNYIDPALSCEQICLDSAVPNLRYVRPPQPVGMVENWNHALPFATGDFVCYLTDKMFVLPNALSRVERAIERAGDPDIVSWIGDTYYPRSFDDYFGDGDYWVVTSDVPSDVLFQPFSPAEDLDRRGLAEVSRSEQTASEYSRGKLAFGAYRRELVERILSRYGALFHNIAPDYTSMVLGLSEARQAVEMASSCVVSVSTDISNGMLGDTHDAAAFAFLNSLAGGADSILPQLLVPGLYASQHNCVAHDYVTLRKNFDLAFTFDTLNWLVYCSEDIYRPTREWSNPRVEAEQKGLLLAFMDSLEPRDAAHVEARIAERAAGAEARLRGQTPARRSLRDRALRRLLPPAPRPTEMQLPYIRFPSVQTAVATRSAAGAEPPG